LLTRREVVAVAAGAVTHPEATFGKASQPGAPVSFDVPLNACDCHTHIFGDPAKFPLWPAARTRPRWPCPKKWPHCIGRSTSIAS